MTSEKRKKRTPNYVDLTCMNCGITMPIAKFRQISYALGYKPRCGCGCCNWCLPAVPRQPYTYLSPYRPVPHFPLYRIYRNGTVTRFYGGEEIPVEQATAANGRAIVRLENDSGKFPVVLAKVVAGCFFKQYKPTWVIYHKDGSYSNCAVENLVCDELSALEPGCRKPTYSWALVEGIRNGSIDKASAVNDWGISNVTYYNIKKGVSRA